MNPSLIPHLLTALAAFPSSGNVTNPYGAAVQVNNLREYLAALCSSPYSGHLFVGEAPGYQGCALTGIPFTSERVLKSGCHPFLVDLLPRLTVLGNTPEPTATMVWGAFAGKQSIPAFWNVFPFHPHDAGVPNSNRTPTLGEISAGRPFLVEVARILCPHTIVAVGEVPKSVAPSMFPSFRHIALRHPSFGGKAEFVSGCSVLGLSCCQSESEPTQRRLLFEQHCQEVSPWPRPLPRLADRHLELMSALKGCLSPSSLSPSAREEIVELSQKLKSGAHDEQPEIRDYVGRALRIAELVLSSRR